jgi:hypothetical protein
MQKQIEVMQNYRYYNEDWHNLTTVWITGKENIIELAKTAEQEQFDSLWVIERLLWSINPQTPYPDSPDGNAASIQCDVSEVCDDRNAKTSSQ